MVRRPYLSGTTSMHAGQAEQVAGPPIESAAALAWCR
jgi:hypothetical protein